MGVPREPTYSLLVVAAFSRRVAALDWAARELESHFGEIALVSPDFSFHHTKYYHASMGTDLVKRLFVFDALIPPDCLPDAKHYTIGLENQLAASGTYPEPRPLNLDPGLVQLGKFLLATTKDQQHRVFLRDGIFAEVTLRFHDGSFDVWPWTYADYREATVLEFLNRARGLLHEKVTALRATHGKN